MQIKICIETNKEILGCPKGVFLLQIRLLQRRMFIQT